MANPFVHVGLATTDLERAKSFYQPLFDWKLHEMDMSSGMSYTMIDVSAGTWGRYHEASGASRAVCTGLPM
jgi:predicted enzyme related to lactoylglutathione lyase